MPSQTSGLYRPVGVVAKVHARIIAAGGGYTLAGPLPLRLGLSFFITPQRWLKDFEAVKIEFKPEVREKLFWRNGQKLLAHTAVGQMTEFALEPAASHGTSVPVVRRLWLEPLYLLHFHFFAPV